MNEQQTSEAQACLVAAETDALAFPEIVGRLIAAGFESYTVDLRRGRATYYVADGSSVDLETHASEGQVEAAFDDSRLREAIREAQAQVPGYTYKGFCEKAKAAGCASYIVSFSGRRALYIGRTGETHVEMFPQ